MKIRKYKPQDKKKVKKLVKDSLLDIFGTADNLWDLDKIEEVYDLFLIAEEDGEIIGTIGFATDEGEPDIGRMYVRKDKRKQGIARKLIEKIFDFCKKKYNYVLTSTYEKMGAMSFYKKIGFKRLKRKDPLDKNIIWLKKEF